MAMGQGLRSVEVSGKSIYELKNMSAREVVLRKERAYLSQYRNGYETPAHPSEHALQVLLFLRSTQPLV